MIYVNSRLASFSLVGHAAEAQWQIIKQGMEEEVCHPVWQRCADLPPEFTCECCSLGEVSRYWAVGTQGGSMHSQAFQLCWKLK